MIACISEDTQEALNVLQVLLAVLFSLKLKGSFRTYDGCCNENEHFPEKFGREAAKKGANF